MSEEGKLCHNLHVKEKAVREGGEKYLSFQQLVELLRKEIFPTERGIWHPDQHIDHIKDLLKKTKINRKEWQQYTLFAPNRYTRNLVGHDAKFTVLLLCWPCGLASPIHDHTGASCWVKVLDGVLVESLYKLEQDGQPPTLVQETFAQPGDVCYINDTYGLHKMGNNSGDTPTISLHIYSPPFTECYIFNPETSEKRLVSLAASNAPQVAEYQDMLMRVPSLPMESIDLIGLVTRLRRENWPPLEIIQCEDSSQDLITRIKELLDKVRLTPQQWNEYVRFSDLRYVRNLVALDEQFSVIILCWHHNQWTPPHDHQGGRHSWFKVISGKLQLKHENGKSIDTFTEDSPVVHEWKSGVHLLGNPSHNECAVSVHVYCPPYKDLTYHDTTGVEKSVPCVFHIDLDEKKSSCQFTISSSCKFFSNFDSFTQLLDREFQNHQPNLQDRITRLFELVSFNQDEWRSYTVWHEEHFTRILLRSTESYTLVLSCWKPGQYSPPHSHAGSEYWIKILEGSLLEENYMLAEKKLHLLRRGTLSIDTVTYLGVKAVHSCRNTSNEPSYSLHLYTPPYYCCEFYGEDGSIKICRFDKET